MNTLIPHLEQTATLIATAMGETKFLHGAYHGKGISDGGVSSESPKKWAAKIQTDPIEYTGVQF